jgi:hypothetical protein
LCVSSIIEAISAKKRNNIIITTDLSLATKLAHLTGHTGAHGLSHFDSIWRQNADVHVATQMLSAGDYPASHYVWMYTWT